MLKKSWLLLKGHGQEFASRGLFAIDGAAVIYFKFVAAANIILCEIKKTRKGNTFVFKWRALREMNIAGPAEWNSNLHAILKIGSLDLRGNTHPQNLPRPVHDCPGEFAEHRSKFCRLISTQQCNDSVLDQSSMNKQRKKNDTTENPFAS